MAQSHVLAIETPASAVLPDSQDTDPAKDRGRSARTRARAAGLTVRLVRDGFTLGRPGGPRERYNTVEALMARLSEIEASAR